MKTVNLLRLSCAGLVLIAPACEPAEGGPGAGDDCPAIHHDCPDAELISDGEGCPVCMSEAYPECKAPAEASVSLTIAVDGTTVDHAQGPFPDDLEAACAVADAGEGTLALDCATATGPSRTLELSIAASPPVGLPAAGTMVYASYRAQSDDLHDGLYGQGLTLREGAAEGRLLLAVSDGHGVVLPGLGASLGAADLCPPQDVDEAACRAYRRTSLTLAADGSELMVFDHGSTDAEDGSLRVVADDLVLRTVAPGDLECSGGDLGPGDGNFAVAVGPPA